MVYFQNKILDGPERNSVCIFYCLLVCLTATDTFYGHSVYFGFVWYIFPFLVHCTKKSGNTDVL
jgi:hypothetical protein